MLVGVRLPAARSSDEQAKRWDTADSEGADARFRKGCGHETSTGRRLPAAAARRLPGVGSGVTCGVVSSNTPKRRCRCHRGCCVGRRRQVPAAYAGAVPGTVVVFLVSSGRGPQLLDVTCKPPSLPVSTAMVVSSPNAEGGSWPNHLFGRASRCSPPRAGHLHPAAGGMLPLTAPLPPPPPPPHLLRDWRRGHLVDRVVAF